MDAHEVRAALRGRFGRGTDLLQARGILRVLDSHDDLPEALKGDGNRRFDKAIFVSNPPWGPCSYLFANQTTDGDDASRSLLHEVGVHYGLKRMLGDAAYRSVLNRVAGSTLTDAGMAKARQHVEHYYQRLEHGSDVFWEEVIARAVDQHKPQQQSWYRKMSKGVGRFLSKIGLKSSHLDSSDLFDIVSGSARRAMWDMQAPRTAHVADPAAHALAADKAVGPVFYSELRRLIESSHHAEAPAAQWSGLIRNARGLKAEEIELSGVLPFLSSEDRRVTRDEILALLSERAFSIHVERSYTAGPDALSSKSSEGTDYSLQGQADVGTLYYRDKSFPGGEDYQEVLICAPTASERRDEAVRQRQLALLDAEMRLQAEGPSESLSVDIASIAADLDALDRLSTRSLAAADFRPGHFDGHPNVIAHLRSTSRMDAYGGRVLVVEEVQSDLHQFGRAQGYRADELGRGYRASAMLPKAPNMPFKTQWPLLAMKWAIRHAAEQGFDRVAWTSGEQQAERAGGFQRITRATYVIERGCHVGHLITFDEDDSIYFQGDVSRADLGLVLGADFAEDLLSGDCESWRSESLCDMETRSAEGNKLVRSGVVKGMSGFYDHMLPLAVGRYVRRWGAEVEPVFLAPEPAAIQSDSGAHAKAVVSGAEPLHGFSVTPEMRASVLRGQPLFRASEPTASPGFMSWSRGAALVDLTCGDHYGGGPAVFRAYHGTAYPDIVDLDAKVARSSVEGHLGAGFYCTTSPTDASENYADENGPDPAMRIELAMESLEHSYEADQALQALQSEGRLDDAIALYVTATGDDVGALTLDGLEDMAIDGGPKSPAYELNLACRRLLAASTVRGPTSGLVMPLLVRLLNPVDLRPDAPTQFENETICIEDPDDPDEVFYDFDQDCSGYHAIEALRNVLADYGMTERQISLTTSVFMEDPYGSFSARDVMSAIRDASQETDPYEFPAGQIFQDWARRLGFDGILMDARADFGNSFDNVEPGALHLMPFESAQVKSAIGNSGRFSDDSPSILERASRPTDSPAFRGWFGDSKIVDRSGAPLVVYHGTRANFDVFENRGGVVSSIFGNEEVERSGFWFTDDPSIASAFADAGEERDGRQLIPAFLSLQNPLDMRPGYVTSDIADRFDAAGLSSRWLARFGWGHLDGEDGKRFVEVASTLGYDGVILWDEDPDGSDSFQSYVAFRPEQIKSAIGNNGSYSPDDPRITARTPEQTDSAQFREWFGDSQVVRPDGAPLVVYHGTDAEFDQFRFGEFGFHFGSEEQARKCGTKVMPVFLSIKNPIHFDTDFSNWGDEEALGDHLVARGVLTQREVDRGDLQGQLMAMGYDGYTYPNGYEGGEKSYAVFSPEQIKSAALNSGDFSPASPVITERRDPGAATAARLARAG